MAPSIVAIQRLLSILDRQETLIRAQKTYIHALQMKVQVLEGQEPTITEVEENESC